MSEAFDRGRNTEKEVAAILRKKLGARVMRDPKSGAGLHKADIRDYFQELPLFVECKDQENIKVKEWMRQTIEGASVGQVPTMVFRMETELFACVPFRDLVNFLVEIADLRAENDDLRKPVDAAWLAAQAGRPANTAAIVAKSVQPAVGRKIEGGAKFCQNGHIVDGWGYCSTKTCKYSRGYRPPKVKK